MNLVCRKSKIREKTDLGAWGRRQAQPGDWGRLSGDAAARHLQQWRHQCAPTQVNQVIRHPHTTFGAVIVNVNKRSVSADACTFTPNYLQGVDLFNSKRTVEG